MYDYFHTGNESSFSHFESVIFSLLKRQQPPPPDRVPCGEDGVKHVEAMAKLFDRVANPRELPLTITENFFEWRGSVQLDALAQSLMNKKVSNRNRLIGLLPLGPFPASIDTNYLTSLISNWMSCFFMGFRVHCLPQISVKQFPQMITRYHFKTKKFQILSTSLIRLAEQYVSQREPKYQCLIVVSWHDLYPEEKMNFELGQGSSLYRCAVMSFGRFEPSSFKTNQPDVKQLTPKIIWQFLKVSAHEVCHVFGMKHCNTFHCLMNGSVSIQQAMKQPLLLCPICLRKLKHFTKANLEHWLVGIRIFLLEILKTYPEFDRVADCIVWINQMLELCDEIEKSAATKTTQHS
ncbi:archaemetzincin-1-like [Symsagittifera roscoffensis]|uniref:archaemetzincin-1-like n=1 Tax=Symsagittifera roscoffensis TaxID=84072 RepID=UPI00307CC5A0